MQVRVFLKEGPTGEAGGDAAFEPLEGGGGLVEDSEDAGGLIVGVMSVSEGFGIGTGTIEAIEGGVGFSGEGEKEALQTDDEGFIGNCFQSTLEEKFGPFPIGLGDGDGCGEVVGIFVGGTLRSPLLDFFKCGGVLEIPEINLRDAGADGFLRVESAAAFVDGASGIQQTDVCEDGAETIVGVREMGFEVNGTFEFFDSGEVLEVFGRAPEQESVSDVSVGEERIEFKSASAMEFGLL